ncbi:hypothetical protein ABK040_014356 [Willaertia magna]
MQESPPFKTRSEMLEYRKLEMIKQAIKLNQQSECCSKPQYKEKHNEAETTKVTEKAKSSLGNNSSSVSVENPKKKIKSNEEKNSGRTPLEKSAMLVRREQQKQITDGPQHIKIETSEKVFDKAPLKEVQYAAFLHSQRSGLDDSNQPLYSSFSKNKSFDPLRNCKAYQNAIHKHKEKEKQKKTTKPNNRFNSEDYIVRPKSFNSQKTDVVGTSFSGSSSISSIPCFMEDTNAKTERTNLSSHSENSKMWCTLSESTSSNKNYNPNVIRPFSASSNSSKGKSISLPARPFTARSISSKPGLDSLLIRGESTTSLRSLDDNEIVTVGAPSSRSASSIYTVYEVKENEKKTTSPVPVLPIPLKQKPSKPVRKDYNIQNHFAQNIKTPKSTGSYSRKQPATFTEKVIAKTSESEVVVK